ncbi:saccharopine dehydrogenase family protein [Mycobacterium sp. C31M]
MTGSGAIVIAGGYGLVGRLLGERLAPRFPGQLIVSGRDRTRAQDVAGALGYGTRAAHLDAADPASVQMLIRTEQPALVVSCAARTEAALAAGCLQSGVNYTDVSADADGIAAVEDLRPIAIEHGATGVLSVGVAPGLTNLLAREVCSGLEQIDRLDIGVQLSIGDEHGVAAMDWTLANLAVPFAVAQRGGQSTELPFATRRQLDFGGPSRISGAGFNFPEQRTLARTLEIPTVRSWLALQPRAVHTTAVIGARIGAARILGSAAVRDPLVRLMSRLPHAAGGFAVCAEATGIRDGRSLRVGAFHRGRGEAAMTAQVAHLVVAHLMKTEERPGVWHVEQLHSAPDLLSAIVG